MSRATAVAEKPAKKRAAAPATAAKPAAASKPHATPRGMKSYQEGTVVISPAGALRGADPFTRLVITAVDTHGNLTIALLGGGKVWRNVAPTTVLERIQL